MIAAAAAAGCRAEDWLQYDWDDRRVLCSNSVDDLTTQDAPWDLIETELELAANRDRATLFHAHVPGTTIRIATIARLLDLADDRGLDYVTFPELTAAAPRRAALALSFDDTGIDEWFAIRDLLAAHGARVTFWVTRFARTTDSQRAELAQLHAEGHAVEPHAVDHLNARDYVRDHGLDAYLADEVLPSIQILRDAGYTPTSFAFPFGASNDAIDDAVLGHVDRVRVSPGSCPY